VGAVKALKPKCLLDSFHTRKRLDLALRSVGMQKARKLGFRALRPLIGRGPS